MPSSVAVQVCVGPGRKPEYRFSFDAAHINYIGMLMYSIFQNPAEPEASQDDEFKVDPGETLQAERFTRNNSALPPPVKKDYSTFPALAGPPRIGDKIAYKV